jgi:hypothetical protein
LPEVSCSLRFWSSPPAFSAGPGLAADLGVSGCDARGPDLVLDQRLDLDREASARSRSALIAASSASVRSRPAPFSAAAAASITPRLRSWISVNS